MTPATITISTEDDSVIDRLRDGIESKELIELFGIKFVGVKLETYTNLGHPHAVMLAQKVEVVQPIHAADYKDRVSGRALNIDWSKAPEGFPIWIEGLNGMFGTGWHRDDGDRWVDQQGSYWPKGADERGNCRIHLAPWSGEGLPPVGIDCEAHRGEWGYATCVAHHDGGAVMAMHEDDLSYSYIWCSARGVRPIRTPSQIAAEEREAAIEQIMADYEYTVGPCTNKLIRSQAARIFDAGVSQRRRKVTTSPVVSITDDLLAELEEEIALCDPGYGAVVNPVHLEALLSHIAELKQQAADREAHVRNLIDSETLLFNYLADIRQAVGDDGRLMLPGLVDHIRDLKQQLVAAGIAAENCELFRKDAERYRWLRDDALKCTFTAPAIMVVDEAGDPVHKGNPWNSLIMDEDADAAIDAARSAGGVS